MNPTASSSPGDQQSAVSRNFPLAVLSGFAILGILVTGIWEFAGFIPNERLRYLTGAGTHGGNHKLLVLVTLLFDGKMLTLLAMLFGAGIVLFMQKEKHPVSIGAADAFIRRQLWLIGFGLILAFIACWPDDILYHFGVVGIILFACWKMPVKGLLIVALLCTTIYSGKIFWNHADLKKDYNKFLAVKAVEKKFEQDSVARAKKDSIAGKKKDKVADSLAKKNDTLTTKQAGEKGNWESMVKNMKYDSAKTAKQNKTMRGAYNKIWPFQKNKAQIKEASWIYTTGIWDIASAMFLGMALLGMGFFFRRFSSSTYFVTAILLIILGTALTWYRLHFNFIRLADFSKYVGTHALPYDQFLPFEKLIFATGYASLLMWLLRVNVLQGLWNGLAIVGRMALSNYVLQVLISAFFFFGYGFGYYGWLHQWEIYGVVAEITMVQVVFSILWLRYYRLGPVEWLLESLVYRKKMPNKLSQPTESGN
jgi:uncharacterized protein